MKTLWTLGVVLNIIGTGWSKFNIDDANLYDIKFNPITEDEKLLNAPDLLQTVVTMTTAHNEKYVCHLPNEENTDKNLDAEYDVSIVNFEGERSVAIVVTQALKCHNRVLVVASKM